MGTTGLGWISCTLIKDVFFSNPVYALYMNNGGLTGGLSNREIRNTIVTDMIVQAGSLTKYCVYMDCMEAEIKLRTLDVTLGNYAVFIPADGINNTVISDTLNPIYDGGQRNSIFAQVAWSNMENVLGRVGLTNPTATFHRENTILWLDAALKVTGNPVATWGDNSPYINNATEATNKPALIPNVINSLPVIRASGSELLTLTNSITLSKNGCAIMMVMKISTLDATPRCLFGDSDLLSFTNVATSTIQMTPSGGTDWVLKANAGLGTASFFILDISADNGTVLCYIDNILISTLVTNSDFVLDKLFDPSFIGDVAEIMVYRQPRSSDARKLDYDYLKAKYGL
jgi:hypothetical protein